MSTRRLFISTVTHEFLTCRQRLSADLRFPDVVAENQEEYVARLAAGSSILCKLDDYIAGCDAVIHLIGQQTSARGDPASKDAVEDLLRRYPDLPEVVRLTTAELRTVSYTQWEAWLAYYHVKTKRPELKLIIATPADAFKADRAAHPDTAHAQKLSQAWHTQELQKRGRYAEITFADEKELAIEILRALKDILPSQQPAQKIAASRLVHRHTTSHFLGREKELALLDAAWDVSPPTSTINILTVIAWGGVGKTALLAEWVDRRFRKQGWKDAVGQPEPLFYFDWTFYDQGTRADDATQAGAASVGTFFIEALRHFGDPRPDLPERKAARLAQRIQQHRSLLVLDGLEPLQYPPNHPQAGQITDPDLRELLITLAQANPGLCLVSSRQHLTDLSGLAHSTAYPHSLDELLVDTAIRLLRQLQVTGSDEDLQQAARDYQGHALSLILLGRYLVVAKGGDIRKRDTIKFERANDQRSAQTRNAWHVLHAYEQWLDSPAGRAADLQALRLLGLFDRPISPDCLAALRSAPTIPGLTDGLVPLADDEWNALLHRLHEAHLIALRFPEAGASHTGPRPEAREVPVDAHPLIREYFSQQLRTQHPQAFQTAHARLFDFLCGNGPHRPDTLNGLQPLYQAVVHGCLAGQQQKACDEVYYDRIMRGQEAFSKKKLGAIGADLGAVSTFFDQPWTRLSPNLTGADQAWLLGEAAYSLRALGRLTEALEPMRVSGEMHVESEGWKNAAISYGNLSELEVTLGRLGAAVADARRAIDFADRLDDKFRQVAARAAAADALHQSGKPGEPQEARALFETAEALQHEDQPEFDLLYSAGGFRFCDLILAPAERAAWHRCHLAACDHSDDASSKPQSSESPQTSPDAQLLALGAQRAPAESASVFASATSESPPAQREGTLALSEAERRATRTLKWMVDNNGPLLDIALDHLTLARVALYRAALAASQPVSDPNPHLAPALDGLRKAATLNHLPKALLTAAHWHALLGDATTARRHLDEAQQIAERGPMPLYLADAHLHRARLVGMADVEDRMTNWPGIDPKAELAKAKDLIERHGYGRRYEELADAVAVAGTW